MYCEDMERKIKMKKIILSLVIAGLSIGGSCFASGNPPLAQNGDQHRNFVYQLVGQRNDFKKAARVAVIGTAVSLAAASFFCPGFLGVVNSGVQVAGNIARKNLFADASKIEEQKKKKGVSIKKVAAVGTVVGVVAAYFFVPNFSALVNSGVTKIVTNENFASLLNRVKEYGEPAVNKAFNFLNDHQHYWNGALTYAKGYLGNAKNVAQPIFANVSTKAIQMWNSIPENVKNIGYGALAMRVYDNHFRKDAKPVKKEDKSNTPTQQLPMLFNLLSQQQ